MPMKPCAEVDPDDVEGECWLYLSIVMSLRRSRLVIALFPVGRKQDKTASEGRARLSPSIDSNQ